MAVTNQHFQFSSTSPSGGRLRNTLNQLEQARDGIARELLTMQADLTGASSSAASFAKVVDNYGFADVDYAKAAFDELLAGIAKIDSLGDPGNTTGVAAKAALDQLFTRLR